MGWAGLSWAVVEEVFEPVVRIRADERAERGCAGSLVSQTNQAAIRLGEERRPVLVLRSATILPCGSRHRGQKGVHLYSRPPTSSKVETDGIRRLADRLNGRGSLVGFFLDLNLEFAVRSVYRNVIEDLDVHVLEALECGTQ